MNKKVVGIFVFILLIVVSFLPINSGFYINPREIVYFNNHNYNVLKNKENYCPYLSIETNKNTYIFYPTDDAFVSQAEDNEVNNYGNLKDIHVANYKGLTEDWERNIFIKFNITIVITNNKLSKIQIMIFRIPALQPHH